MSFTERSRNLFPRPTPNSPGAGLPAGWFGATDMSYSVTTEGVRATFVGAPGSKPISTTIGGSGANSAELALMVDGLTYGGAIQVRPSVTMPMRCMLSFRTAGSAFVGDSAFGPGVVCPPNTWTTLFRSGVSAPALTAAGGVRVQLATEGFVFAGGETVDMRRMTVTSGTSAPQPFDGGMPSSPSQRYSWLGTAGASVSITEIESSSSLADLELGWLQARGATGSLNDARAQIYTPEDHSYWAAISLLAPAQRFSLADHTREAMRVALGLSVAVAAQFSNADLARQYWAL